ncbi:PILR alpha-associated neural protein [Xenopus tropicalis]|uniref:PILR alpha-associated neural protein n=1 Tax=Xenopus tropicalis TaxID=8364 RepID=Q0VFR3_XENTR|eukprot:NP_001072773.1 PILR alpha-associated neural protein [Xenopus tropicalis]
MSAATRHPHPSFQAAQYQAHPPFHPTSDHSHLPLHTAARRSAHLLHSAPHSPFPVAQAQKLSARTATLPKKEPHHLHHHSGSPRGKRQSPAPSVLFPVAFEGAAPPSQYPWAIVWGPTVSDEDGGALSSASSTPRSGYHQDGSSHENKKPIGLDLRGAPTTLRPPIYPPVDEETDPQLYVTIVISLLIVLAATGIIIKFCCERRQKRRRHRSDRCPLPEEGSLQPLTDLSPDTDISGLHALKLGDSKSGPDIRIGPCRTSKIPVVTM